MNLRPYVIQESRHQSFDFFNVPRVNYDELLDTLKFPVVWSYDDLLKAWIPGEIDYATVRYLIELPNDFDETITPQRLYQLRRAGVLDPKERKTIEEMVRSMREDQYVYKAELEAGDAVLYAGTRDLHWRDATPPGMKSVAGIFFHFGRKDFEGSLD